MENYLKHISSQIYLTLLLFGLAISIIATLTFTLPNPKASNDFSSIPTNLSPPYIRLVQSPLGNTQTSKSIDVLINTNHIQTNAADIVIDFDPDILSINQQNVENLGLFEVLSINQIGESSLSFSLFNNFSTNQPPVVTSNLEEVAIARVTFDLKNTTRAATQISIDFTPSSLQETNLIEATPQRVPNPTDILTQAQGIKLNLTP